MSISGIGGGLALPNIYSGSAAGSADKKSPEEEFLAYARQSPAERIRAAILKEMGISEEELEAMSPEARTAIEKAIAERIKDKLLADEQPRPGSIVDVTVRSRPASFVGCGGQIPQLLLVRRIVAASGGCDIRHGESHAGGNCRQPSIRKLP